METSLYIPCALVIPYAIAYLIVYWVEELILVDSHG